MELIIAVRRQLTKLRKLEAALRQRSKPGAEDVIKFAMLEYGKQRGELTKEEEKEHSRLNALLDSDERTKLVKKRILGRPEDRSEEE